MTDDYVYSHQELDVRSDLQILERSQISWGSEPGVSFVADEILSVDVRAGRRPAGAGEFQSVVFLSHR